jgi:hypothetical protein
MDKHKLGIIVPYRNRPEHLDIFKTWFVNYLGQTNIDYEIIIVNQDNGKQFNRGMLLNIGFEAAKEMGCDYVVFHDIDMIPIYVDYSFSETPLHLATHFDPPRDQSENFDEYFGGVTMFTIQDFMKINGYSNKYWDWGYEDTDLLYRCEVNGINLDNLIVKNTGKSGKILKFNGVDSYVKGRNVFDLDNNLTFFVTLHPDDILCDHTKDNDYYSVFSIPGYDTSISFNSFSRYNFCTFDEDKNALYVNSTIKTNYSTNITVTIDNTKKNIRVFQDGVFIGETKFTKRLMSYSYERYFYLGVGDPNRAGDERFFKGGLTSFVSFSKVLDDEEILDLSNNERGDFRFDFGNYKSSDSLLLYYDVRHVNRYTLTDLSGNGYHGKIEKCEINSVQLEETKAVSIPHRRESLYRTIPHENNGFENNKWKNKATRWNQLKFYNEVKVNKELMLNDGLCDLDYYVYGTTKEDKITIINVAI